MAEKKQSFFRRIWNAFLLRRKAGATIDLKPDGFVFTLRGKATEMRWDEIIQIDAGVRDNFTFDSFYVVLFSSKQKLGIDELDDGFRQLEFEVLARWPQIKQRWQEILSGQPAKVFHETLWRRGGAF